MPLEGLDRRNDYIKTILTFRWLCIVINSYNKPSRCTKLLKFIFWIKLYMFRTVPLSITSNDICHTGLLTVCEQDQDGTAVPSWSCSQAVWHKPLLCLQWKTPDIGQRNCPKHVKFYSKNNFDKLVNIVGFITRIKPNVRNKVLNLETSIFCLCTRS